MDKVIVVVGPTGVGKTKKSIEIAKACNGEIISGDAYQCYYEMSIGSAKIKEEEKEGIPHYLVDCISYQDEYNVKIFQEKARQHIQDMISRNKVPIICGGTGLYIKALLYDYVFEDEEVDEEYVTFLQTKSNEELYTLLKSVDEQSTDKIHINNRQRIIRALLMAHQGTKKSERIEKQQHTMLYDAYIIGLSMPRAVLYERINERVLQMMKEGLLVEVQTLYTQDQYCFEKVSMQGIGYKEWKPYFNQEATIEEVVASIQKNSRNFAKRQYTWFNNQMNVHWYDVSEKDIEDLLVKESKSFLEDTYASESK